MIASSVYLVVYIVVICWPWPQGQLNYLIDRAQSR